MILLAELKSKVLNLMFCLSKMDIWDNKTVIWEKEKSIRCYRQFPLGCTSCDIKYAAAAKSLQSCPTLCNPRDGIPPGSPVPGILQARTLEWVAISFSSAWKWKVKVKPLSPVRLLATSWTAAYQAPPSMGFFQARVLEWGAIAFSYWCLALAKSSESKACFTLVKKAV